MEKPEEQIEKEGNNSNEQKIGQALTTAMQLIEQVMPNNSAAMIITATPAADGSSTMLSTTSNIGNKAPLLALDLISSIIKDAVVEKELRTHATN